MKAVGAVFFRENIMPDRANVKLPYTRGPDQDAVFPYPDHRPIQVPMIKVETDEEITPDLITRLRVSGQTDEALIRDLEKVIEQTDVVQEDA